MSAAPGGAQGNGSEGASEEPGTPDAQVPRAAEPWREERSLTVEIVRPWLAAAAPWLADAPIRAFSSGWDNAAFLVGDDLVVRFPRRELAVDLLATESAVLPHLGERLPLPVPVPELTGTSLDERAWPFLGYRLLDGTTACRAGLDDAARTALAPALGDFLGTLHALDVDEARSWGAPPDRLRRLDVAYRSERAIDALAEAVTEGWLPSRLVRGLHARLEAAADLEPRGLALCHGDLYARHVLVADGRVTGILDWGDLHVGDPAVDLALARTFLPAGAQAAFRSAYAAHAGEPDEATWRLADLRAVAHSAALLEFGLRAGEPELAAEATRALHALGVDTLGR